MKLKTHFDVRNFSTTHPKKTLMSLNRLSLPYNNATQLLTTTITSYFYTMKYTTYKHKHKKCCPTSTAEIEFKQKTSHSCASKCLDTTHRIYLLFISLLIIFLFLSFINFQLPTRIAKAYKIPKQTKQLLSYHHTIPPPLSVIKNLYKKQLDATSSHTALLQFIP